MSRSEDNNTKIERSIVAGIKRNSISFRDITILANGGTYTTTIPNYFIRSMINFTITISEITKTIQIKSNKKLIGNMYQPPVVNNYNHIFLR